MKVHGRSILPVFSFFLLSCVVASGQERFQERLPENTLAYVATSGRQSLDGVRGTNPLLRLLASREMQANWEALQASQSRPKDPKSQQTISGDDEEFLELLKAPGVVALLPPDVDASPGAAGPPQPTVLFLLDSTGQEARIERLRTRAQGEGSSYVSYEFEGITVEEARNRTGAPTG